MKLFSGATLLLRTLKPFILRCRLLIAVLFCFGSVPIVKGQQSNSFTDIPKLIPASPEAASLGIYGQIPVGNYRGIPEISVPLFTVQEGKLKLPISLSYHASGVKVEEMASSVGLGWTLNAGGGITRALKGLQDEAGVEGFRYNGTIAQQMADGQLSSSAAQSYMLQIFRQQVDGEADIFYFNFGGASGKFFFGNDGKVYTSPRSDLSVEYNDTNNGWVITDGNGIKYTFFAREETVTEPFVKYSTGGGYQSNNEYDMWSAWYLTRIEDPFGNFISIVYEGVGNIFRTKAIDTRNLLLGTGSSCPATSITSYNQITVWTGRVKEIDYSSGKIVFNLGTTERLDLPDNYPVETISQYNSNNVLVKTYRLYTSYFNTSGIGGCEDAVQYRLRLDSIKEMGTNGLTAKPYVFTYNAEQNPPCRLSNAQDYWGYYNGQDNSEFVRYKLVMTSNTYTGANKEPNINFTKSAILQSMSYPTGGHTDFSYEPNTYARGIAAGYDKDHIRLLESLHGNNNGAVDYHTDYQETFTISAGSIPAPGYRLVTVSFTKYCADPTVINMFTIGLSRPGYSKALHDGDTLHLIAGNYTLSGSIETEFAGRPQCYFDCYLNETPYYSFHYNTYIYGGLRIQQIKSYDGVSSQPNILTYNYNRFAADGTPDTVSSGDYGGLPDQTYYEYDKAFALQSPPDWTGPCSFHVFNSVSNYPLLATGGTPIGYTNVTVSYGPNGTGGKEQYSYTSYSDFPLALGLTYPFFFSMEYDWREGLLTKMTTYSYEGGSYVPVQQKAITYDFHASDTTSKVCKVIMAGRTKDWDVHDIDLYDLDGLSTIFYLNRAEAFNVSSDTTVTFDKSQPTNSVKEINTYLYNTRNFQMQQQTSTNSRLGTLITKKRFPMDFTISGTPNNDIARGVQNLQNRHIINPVVEQSVSRNDAGGANPRVISSVFVNYSPTAPAESIVSKLEQTQGITDYIPASISAASSSIDTRYSPRVYYDQYDGKGNIMAIHKGADAVKSYIWDYNNDLPVAEVANSGGVAAYTSFESNGTGNWTVGAGVLDSSTALSGTKCHTLNSDVSISGLSSASTYVVSYWTTNATPFTITGTLSANGYPIKGRTAALNGYSWTYYEHKVTGQTSIQITGTGRIDELRLYPDGSLMTTYTYIPLVGLQTQCDAGGLPTYYEYDGLSRLLRIRDMDYNILKQYDYQYQVKAGYANVLKTGTFTKTCTSGGTGTTMSYAVPAGTYVSSISQADADTRAQNDVNANGQNYVNDHGICTYSSVAKSGTFQRTNCGSNSTGGSATYTVAAGAYTSTISQADADAKAQADVNANGPGYANTHASCTAWIAITGHNLAGASGVTVKFTRVGSGESYTFGLGNGTIGYVPPGTYNVHFAASATYWMGFTCGSSSQGTSFNINNVDVTACAQVYVDTSGSSD